MWLPIIGRPVSLLNISISQCQFVPHYINVLLHNLEYFPSFLILTLLSSVIELFWPERLKKKLICPTEMASTHLTFHRGALHLKGGECSCLLFSITFFHRHADRGLYSLHSTCSDRFIVRVELSHISDLCLPVSWDDSCLLVPLFFEYGRLFLFSPFNADSLIHKL